MNENQFNQMVRIFNTLALVTTSGENTIVMGQCLSAFKDLITEVQKTVEKKEEIPE